MAPSAALAERDQRTGPRTALAGYRAGASPVDLTIAGVVDPTGVRCVLSSGDVRRTAQGMLAASVRPSAAAPR